MREESLEGIDGVRVIPDAPSGVAVLVLAGSSGRVDRDRARVFAEAGVVAESVRWFGGPGQHPGPWEIPLETFLDRIDGLARESDRVVVAGTSFGAEAALLVGAHSPEVSAVVAFAPSDVVWAGVTEDGRVTSHWTRDGRPVPFVPFDEDWRPVDDPPAFRTLYEASRRRHPAAVAAARIPVESIGELVVVAGGDDQVWPSVDAALAIVDVRSRHGLETGLVVDPEAGHRTLLPGEPVVSAGATMARGGNEEADRRLGRAAWRSIEAFLRG